jgi:hypothetical protein
MRNREKHKIHIHVQSPFWGHREGQAECRSCPDTRRMYSFDIIPGYLAYARRASNNKTRRNEL